MELNKDGSPKWYGFYSEKMASLFGYSIYETVDGSAVRVTVMTHDPKESGCKWNDIVMVGELGKMINHNYVLRAQQDEIRDYYERQEMQRS